MGFLWRRRSSVLKIVCLLSIVWFTVAFLIYSDDRRGGGVGDVPVVASLQDVQNAALVRQAGGGGAAPVFDDGNDLEVKGGGGGAVAGDAAGAAAALSAARQAAAAAGPAAVPQQKAPPVQRGGGDGDQDAVDEAVAVFSNVIAGKLRAKEQQKAEAALDDDKNVLNAPVDNSPDAPGEMGKPVVLPANLTKEVKKTVDDGWLNNAFNQYASDLISVHRHLPDPRDAWCKEPNRYRADLPATDVIICFHNEAWSVLLRTVHSVLDRSPDHLIGHVILVDDFSDMPHTKKQLEDYFAAYPKVKIVRAAKREGLIRARLLGARHARAPVLTYLDSHCECTIGWLEPLLDRIARNSTTVVCPVIDVIDDTTLEYHWRDSGGVNVGGFDWSLQFNWHAVPERERKRHSNSAEPVWSPTMAGGLFSIDRDFFERLGTYDSGFDIWGGENLELSFKTWMCGGTLEIVPCSHVGHIFRKRSPYKWRSGVNVLKRNSVRLAEVWLDEYAQYYYQRIGNEKGDYGDITSRTNLRKNLGCKSFKWYLDEIYPELFIPGEAVASGEIRNKGFEGRFCLDSPARKKDLRKAVGLYPCHSQGGNQIANIWSEICIDSAAKQEDMQSAIGLWPCHGQGGNQYWMLSKAGEIRRDEACLDYSGGDVVLYPCHGSKGNQMWVYDVETSQIRHGSSDKCLAINDTKKKIIMEDCSRSHEPQRWRLENYDPKKY